MPFDTALNVAWLVLGSLALASTARAYRQRAAREKTAPAWLHICGVALIMAALFPYISATDDVLRIQHMDLQQTSDRHGDSGKKTASDGLLRLYEITDSPVVAHVPPVAVVLVFVALVVSPIVRPVTRGVCFETGRSPPALPA